MAFTDIFLFLGFSVCYDGYSLDLLHSTLSTGIVLSLYCRFGFTRPFFCIKTSILFVFYGFLLFFCPIISDFFLKFSSPNALKRFKTVICKISSRLSRILFKKLSSSKRESFASIGLSGRSLSLEIKISRTQKRVNNL